mmetsp:Transcript_3242/g.4551  ORF Transcript_3242/g.4551 Transcript_3242/m.4551 type:complete len:567 (+) Transcript_3242:23-1723(+)
MFNFWMSPKDKGKEEKRKIEETKEKEPRLEESSSLIREDSPLIPKEVDESLDDNYSDGDLSFDSSVAQEEEKQEEEEESEVDGITGSDGDLSIDGQWSYDENPHQQTNHHGLTRFPSESTFHTAYKEHGASASFAAVSQSPTLAEPDSSTGSRGNGSRRKTARPGRELLLQSCRLDSPFDNTIGDSLKKPNVVVDTSRHIPVLIQMYGSVWPTVLPFCCINVLICYVTAYLVRHGIDYTVPSSGHSFMSVLVAFLVVSRSQITYARFMEARSALSGCFRNSRELIHWMAILTMGEKGDLAKKWRIKVALKTLILLRTTITTHKYKNHTSGDVYDILSEELQMGDETNDEREETQTHLTYGMQDRFRAPEIAAYALRKAILEQRQPKITYSHTGERIEQPILTKPMHCNEELKLLSFVVEFVKAFHDIKTLTTTPFPFPLVQMTRTFLFFWVFTLPLALVQSSNTREPFEIMLILFFLTYGFIGLEYVSMELDDPFGEDPNDFDDLAMAQMVLEDIYLVIYTTDGIESAEKVRTAFKERHHCGNVIKNAKTDLMEILESKRSLEMQS